MLAKRFRLKSRRIFSTTLNTSAGFKLFSHRLFVVYALPRLPESVTPDAWPEFGIIISKKVHKRAHERNLIRRRIREIIRTQWLPRFAKPLQSYRAIILIVRQAAVEARFQDLTVAMQQALSKPEHKPAQKPPQQPSQQPSQQTDTV